MYMNDKNAYLYNIYFQNYKQPPKINKTGPNRMPMWRHGEHLVLRLLAGCILERMCGSPLPSIEYGRGI